MPVHSGITRQDAPELAGHHEHCSFFALLMLVNFFDHLKPQIIAVLPAETIK